jgi:hypothetical protein
MKKTKSLRQLKKIATDLDWHISDYGNEITFSKYSSYGQDFSFTIGSDNLVRNLGDYIGEFDVSEETYKWLDDSGHGTNGAPYDMIDVYKDMEDCKEMMQELLNAWED